MLSTRITNASIVTMDPDRPAAQELGIWRGRIVGLDEDVAGLPARRTLDLGGATVLPGFIDAHVHLALDGPEGEGARCRAEPARRRRAPRGGGGGRPGPRRRLGGLRRLRPARSRPPAHGSGSRRRQRRTQGVSGPPLRTRLPGQLGGAERPARGGRPDGRLPRGGRHGRRAAVPAAALAHRTGLGDRARRPPLPIRGHHGVRRGGGRGPALRTQPHRGRRVPARPRGGPTSRPGTADGGRRRAAPGRRGTPRTPPAGRSTSVCARASGTARSPWARSRSSPTAA